MLAVPLDVRIDQLSESIDRLTSTEFEARPTLAGGRLHHLYDAARATTRGPLARGAAEALIEAAKSGQPVLVSAGWVIDFWYPRGEICGMTGAAALSRAISMGLGVQVCFVAEEQVLPVFAAISQTLGMRVYPVERLGGLPNVIASRSFPADPTAAQRSVAELLDTLKPCAIVTVEKCSPNIKGVFHTGRGTDMSATTARIDLVIEEAKRRGILTIGIGDLGNEIGFGKIRDTVAEWIPNGKECRCGCGGGMAAAVETDHLVVASSSNRGAYAVEAALALLLDRLELMHTGDVERRMILAAGAAGAIDSFTVGPTATDGHGVDMHYSACLVDLLRQIVLCRNVEFAQYQSRS